MSPDQKKAYEALSFIIPLFRERNFRWVITGGFACYVYGVKRNLTDVDTDIDTHKDSEGFQNFMTSLDSYISQPLEHFVDQNYDNYNFEVTIEGQIVDICPMAEMKIKNKETDEYEPFYKNGFPKIELVDFFGLTLALLAKELIIKNKEMLVWQRESDKKDIAGLQLLLEHNGTKEDRIS